MGVTVGGWWGSLSFSTYMLNIPSSRHREQRDIALLISLSAGCSLA